MPKKGKTTVRSGFLPFLWNLSHLSTDRGSPPRINARGLTDTITRRSSRAGQRPVVYPRFAPKALTLSIFYTYSRDVSVIAI